MATTTTAANSINLNIVSRLQTLPIVSSALDLANQSYARLKSYNPLVNATLDRAEKSLTYVANSAMPVVSGLQQPITYADNIACQGFEKLQQSVPAIKKSPEEIRRETLKYYDQTKGRLVEVKQQAVEKVHSVFGMFDSIVNSLDTTINAAGSALDYLLPRQLTEQEVREEEDDSIKVDKSSALSHLIHRMAKLSDKVRRRVADYTRYKWLPAIFGSVVVLKSKAALSLNGVMKTSGVKNGLRASKDVSNDH